MLRIDLYTGITCSWCLVSLHQLDNLVKRTRKRPEPLKGAYSRISQLSPRGLSNAWLSVL
jgi:predicted DsbA family dithiol-disulfide isomerase